MLILGIETSCDETAAALLRTQGDNMEVLSNVVSSQVKLHAEWGGVVPNLAAREHLKNIIPVIESCLREASISPEEIDLIAATQGPGLIPALLIGTNSAAALSYVWKKPLIGIHHIEGHIYANFISDKICVISNNQFLRPRRIRLGRTIPKQTSNSKFQNTKQADIKFPVLCLVVSGGHTQLVLMKKHLDYEIVGQTLDDAAGEAFDKVARILGLGYPGGPAIAKRATQNVERGTKITSRKTRNAKRGTWSENHIPQYALRVLRLPRPMLDKKNFDFSFSGLKTAVLYLIKKNEKLLQDENFVNEVAHEFQQAVIDVLIAKTLAAAKKYDAKTIMLAGGVSANQELRHQIGEAIKNDLPLAAYCLPPTAFSIDNAAMIAAAGYFRWKELNKKERANLINSWKNMQASANLKLS